jgi:hypothetical protein
LATNANDNPFLRTKLFRSSKDQKRIDEEKEAAQSARVHISLGIQYGWYSQNTADHQGYYDEYFNGEDQTVAVTHVLDSPTAERPAVDAKFIGTIKGHKRRVSTDGDELVGIRVMFNDRSRTIVDPKYDTVGQIADFVGAARTDTVRVEENGQTVYEGTVSRCAMGLDRSKTYSIIFTTPVKAPAPVAAPPVVKQINIIIEGQGQRSYDGAATLGMVLRELNTENVKYKPMSNDGRDYSEYTNYKLADFGSGGLTFKAMYLIHGLCAGWAAHGTNLGAHLTRYGASKNERYTFNGVEVADPNHYPIERSGTLGQLKKEVQAPAPAPVHLGWAAAAAGAPPAPPSASEYVDHALKKVMTPAGAASVASVFGRKTDWQGETHTEKASWDRHIAALYRNYRAKASFRKAVVGETSADFRTRAARRGYDDRETVVYMTETGTNTHHVICNYNEWKEILGVDL